MSFDAILVQHDTGKPLLALLTDDNGRTPIALSGPDAPTSIAVHLRERSSGSEVIGVCDVVNWPEPVNGVTVQAARYGWAQGGADFSGPVAVEWLLTYVDGPVTVPTRRPLSVLFRKPA